MLESSRGNGFPSLQFGGGGGGGQPFLIRAARSSARGRSCSGGGVAGLLNAAEAPGWTETQTPGGGPEGSSGAMQRAAKPKGALNRGGVCRRGQGGGSYSGKRAGQEGHFAAEQGASEAAADDDFDQEMKAN